MGIGKKKQPNVAIDSGLAGRIPYSCGYEEEGMIKAGKDFYSKMYMLDPVDPKNLGDYDASIMHNQMERLFNGFPYDVSLQFVVHNRLVDAESYVAKIILDPKKTDYPEVTENYDRVLIDNASVGHNNLKKTVYFVLGVHADLPDDAVQRFRELDPLVQKAFQGMYGITVKGLTFTARLKVMYSMFNPGRGDFGKKIDLTGDGKIDLKNLKYMHLTSKDLVAPSGWNSSPKLIDYSILNDKTEKPQYARAFFINLLPRKVSTSFISDLTNVSSSMIFSMIMEPVDTALGFAEATERVKDNTIVTRKAKRDTIADRKNRVYQQVEEMKIADEEGYADKAALSTFKYALDRSQKTFLVTMTIVLFNEDQEALDKDSSLLQLSAAKFSASINSLDMQQCQGIQTSLPLCRSTLDVTRLLNPEQLADMNPIGIQDAIKQNGLYFGLNTINDTLVLLNRKNNTNLNGFITGTDHSGKTYQNKREIVNALLGSNDTISVIVKGDEYDDFAKKLGGTVLPFGLPDVFSMEEGYGLTEDDLVFKSYYLEALIASLQNFRETCQPDEAEEKAREVEEEIDRLITVMRSSDNLPEYLSAHKGEFPFTVHALNILSNYKEALQSSGNRLTIYKVSNESEILMLLDYLWNQTIRDKKQNRTNWIFIDPVDDLLIEAPASDYLSKFQVNANLLQTILTVVVQQSAHLISQPISAVAFETVLQGCGYIKLLNQGPKERKRLADVLQIPHALIPYITNVEPGKGVILTPSSNITFNDNCNELYPDSPFKDLFHTETKQLRF